MESFSWESATSMANMAIERHVVGETEIQEMTTETPKRITENHASTENTTTMEREDTGRLIVGRRRKRNTMTSTTFFWDPHYVEKSQNMTRRNISNNGWETLVHHRT